MLQSELLYEMDGFQITSGLFVALIGSSFLGFRMGRYFARRGRAALQSQVQTIEAAMLTLLGLLLAFTFSIAASRFDSRKQVCVQEANAIGTAYLRTSLMPHSEFENHVPENILIFLFTLATVVIGVVSYMNGLSLDRQPSLMFLLAGIIAMTIFLLIDLDRPLRGLICMAPASMQRTKVSMIVDDRL